MNRFPVLLALGIALVVSTVVGAGAYVSAVSNDAFNSMNVGQSEGDVIRLFGRDPSMRQGRGVAFPTYAAESCSGSCVERLWFENRLSLDTDAWSVDLDENQKVVDKARWISP